MNQHWLVIHSLTSYAQHPDMIGVLSASQSDPIPTYPPFSRIRRGDDVVYYATRNSVIVGIFQVVSDLTFINDAQWGPSCVFRITPKLMPPRGKVLDFKSLISDPLFKLELFHVKQNWRFYLRGHACRPLSDNDFQVLKDALLDGGKLIPVPEPIP